MSVGGVFREFFFFVILTVGLCWFVLVGVWVNLILLVLRELGYAGMGGWVKVGVCGCGVCLMM